MQEILDFLQSLDWSPEMGIPKELYLKEEDILLLTDS